MPPRALISGFLMGSCSHIIVLPAMGGFDIEPFLIQLFYGLPSVWVGSFFFHFLSAGFSFLFFLFSFDVVSVI